MQQRSSQVPASWGHTTAQQGTDKLKVRVLPVSQSVIWGPAGLGSGKAWKCWHLSQALRAGEGLDTGEWELGIHTRRETARARPAGQKARMGSRAPAWPSGLLHTTGARAALRRLVVGSRESPGPLR